MSLTNMRGEKRHVNNEQISLCHATNRHALLITVSQNEKKENDQYAEGKRWVFSFDLREESEDECLTERGREFQITGPMITILVITE